MRFGLIAATNSGNERIGCPKQQGTRLVLTRDVTSLTVTGCVCVSSSKLCIKLEQTKTWQPANRFEWSCLPAALLQYHKDNSNSQRKPERSNMRHKKEGSKNETSFKNRS
jgi:hypothetical protein